MATKEKMLFAEHLALMLKGGLPLSEALETIRNDTADKGLKKAISGVLKRVMEGESFSKALARHPRFFDRFSQSLVKIGEESGTLEENLRYLSLKLRKDDEMAKKVRGALVYPALIVGVACGMMVAMSVFVLPKIINLFVLLQVDLPLTTRIMIFLVVFTRKYWYFVLAGIFVLSQLVQLLRRAEAVRFFFDQIALSFPIVGEIVKSFNLSFFSRTFYVLLKSGVPLMTALDIIAETMPSRVYGQKVIKVKEKIETGERIGASLREYPRFFPGILSGMIASGEKAGTIEDSFLYLADYYEREMDAVLRNFSTLLEPLLLIFIGIFVGLVAMAIISPIYKLVGQMRVR